ncbi:hypothetical protein VTN31DRAFT_5145 [Thermomyces dupontii]|uniref:uncharacterized protein n=1 Tax=Talaromyces thermophilus TaxID=28565 RepID=UPI003743A53F
MDQPTIYKRGDSGIRQHQKQPPSDFQDRPGAWAIYPSFIDIRRGSGQVARLMLLSSLYLAAEGHSQFPIPDWSLQTSASALGMAISPL